jgi:phage portal protein BeeE
VRITFETGRRERERTPVHKAPAGEKRDAVAGSLFAAGSYVEPRTLSRQVWDVNTARQIPGLGRGLDLIGGLIAQMPLDAFRGIVPLPRPRLLEDPDLDHVRSLFVRLQVDDYQLHGNAAHLVTVRYADTGMPAATRWFPAQAWHTIYEEGRRRYWLHGHEVNPTDVIHVQNGADPLNPARGVGIVERYVRTLDRVALEEERERVDLTDGSVPSVAIIAPDGDDSSPEELDEEAERWEEKFAGPGRRPAILPGGTKVVPLAWSPTDAQMVEARRASLTDVANMLNLDGYWLGAPASSHTYRTPGPLFTVLVRTTLEGILSPFEDTWSKAWLPRGQRVTFARSRLTADDLATQIGTLVKATGGPVMTTDEARTVISLGPVPGGDTLRTAAEAAPAPDDEPPNPDDEPDDEPAEEE